MKPLLLERTPCTNLLLAIAAQMSFAQFRILSLEKHGQQDVHSSASRASTEISTGFPDRDALPRSSGPCHQQ